MNLNQAIEYGRRIGVRYYVKNSAGCIIGGTKTKAQAEEMKKRHEADDKKNPWTKGTTKFYIEEIAAAL